MAEVAEDLPVPESVTAWDLGAGESAVLAWPLAHPGATALIDDLAARRRGVIPSARRVVGELREAGMYISDAVVDRALTLVAE